MGVSAKPSLAPNLTEIIESGKAAMCTGAEVDWNLIDSDHAGVKLWLDVRKIK